MANSNTSMCNQSLGILGANRINDFGDATEDSTPAIECRLHFEPTRDALLRLYSWRFARARETLVLDADEDPDFEWDNQFILPNDFLAMRSIYEGRFSDENLRSYALEGQRLLTNELTMEIRYVKKVTDPTKFDPLFVEMFVWHLSDKMIGPLAGGDGRIQEKIDRRIKELMPFVIAMDMQETNTEGQYNLETWNDARYT